MASPGAMPLYRLRWIEPSGGTIILAGGPAEIRSSGCSASAITTAAILAGG